MLTLCTDALVATKRTVKDLKTGEIFRWSEAHGGIPGHLMMKTGEDASSHVCLISSGTSSATTGELDSFPSPVPVEVFPNACITLGKEGS